MQKNLIYIISLFSIIFLFSGCGIKQSELDLAISKSEQKTNSKISQLSEQINSNQNITNASIVRISNEIAEVQQDKHLLMKLKNDLNQLLDELIFESQNRITKINRIKENKIIQKK